MSIRNTIEQAEYKWLREAYDFCRNCFSSTYLPSHDETHHLRAWHFAKELIPGYHRDIHPLSPEHVEGILLAVMLHDTGMSETIDVNHGLAGRQLSEKFFGDAPSIPVRKEAILSAIERHDDKTYTSHPPADTDEGVILTVLSMADDMDAFGAVGIFRYYEIYRLRGIPVEKMAVAVLSNLDRRYEIMEMKLHTWPQLLKKTGKRYRATRSFFGDLQAGHSGALSVTDIFEDAIRQPRKSIERALPGILMETHDPYITAFFTGMQRALSSFHLP